MSLLGTGVADPLGTLVRVCSFAASKVRVTVSYDLGGMRDSVETDLSAFDGRMNCADSYAPLNATNIGIHVVYSTGSASDPWVAIFQASFSQPVEKCYRVTEMFWGEIECDENAQCPPY